VTVLFYCEECGLDVIPDEASEESIERAEHGQYFHDLCWLKRVIRQILSEASGPVEPTVEKIMEVIERQP
jgi:hypothetical protein